jgi:hypothetical protein
MRKSRPVDSVKQVQRLEKQHQTLKERVKELDRRSFLTADEQAECLRLKKKKLATKDALQTLRADTA